MRVWRALIGRPLEEGEAAKTRIGSVQGLSAFSLDALTSVAYGPEAILVVLATAGAAALDLVLPITLVIVGLLALVVFSYRQVIQAYSSGGGAYAVSRANFPPKVSEVAAAALLVDYVLTVSVSLSAGVGALTSAFTALVPATVPIALAILAVITILNLRGLNESATAFLPPTVLFVGGVLAVVAIGLVHPLGLDETLPGRSLVAVSPAAAVSVLLVLKAFSSGCSALTGVEAIANGVPAFREPRVQRARRTELLLGVLLGMMLLGLAALAVKFHIGPRSDQTVLSLLTLRSLGHNWAYIALSLVTTVALSLAANTSFGALPVLTSLLARDNYLPHAFAVRGDRLIFSNGVWAVACLSGLTVVVARGNTNTLIPLFAIGVFIGFTLSQAGLVAHWRRLKPPRWRVKAAVSGVGAALTGITTLIFLVTKFTSGAWIVMVVIPALVGLFHRIRAYYALVYRQAGPATDLALPPVGTPLVIVPVKAISRVTASALADAKAFGCDVVAVHVVLPEDKAQAQQLAQEWKGWSPGVPLELLDEPYHSVVTPIVGYVQEQLRRSRRPVLVVIPGVSPRKLRHRLLHNQLELVLSRALHRHEGVLVSRLPLRISD